MSREVRASIPLEQLRSLRWALEELLFRRETSLSAFRSLALLAEIEPLREIIDVFVECFHPFQPQFPLPLETRLELLQGIFTSDEANLIRKVAVQAICSALSAMGGFSLRNSKGFALLDGQPRITYQELFLYYHGITELLMEAVKSEEAFGDYAKSNLVNALLAYSIQVPPDGRVITKLTSMVDLILNEGINVPI